MTIGRLGLFLVRRLGALLALLLIVSFLVFGLQHLAPGSPVDVLLGSRPRTPETVLLLKEQYNLDAPFLVQYWEWLQGAVRLDFGDSIQSTLPVRDELLATLPVSIFLAFYALVIELIVGIGVGVAAAFRQGSALDRGLMALSIVGLSTPAFVSGVFMLYLFSVALGWFPPFGAGEGFADRLWHLTLPAIALAIVAAAFIAKHTRAAVIAVIDQDYVTFARARGLSRNRVLVRYVLRNATIPILSVSSIMLSHLIVGAVFVEVTFSISGLGQLVVDAANSQNLPMVQGAAMLIAFIVVILNLLADLAYMAVDPRIRSKALR